MPVKPATYWEVTCDHEGCKRDLSDITGEWTAMADESSAIDHWVDAEGVLLPDGRTLCRDHRPGCTGCGGWLEDPTESPRCMDCEPEAAAGSALTAEEARRALAERGLPTEYGNGTPVDAGDAAAILRFADELKDRARHPRAADTQEAHDA